jgi:putative cell wall-binding protein
MRTRAILLCALSLPLVVAAGLPAATPDGTTAHLAATSTATSSDDAELSHSDGVAEPASRRLSGADRYATSTQISGQYAPGVPRLYVATGTSFPDALAAGAAAGASSPVLLVGAGGVEAATAAEVERLAPGQIVLVGGPGVLPDAIGVALGRYSPGGWIRLAGPDRYTTAAAVAASAFTAPLAVAYLASGVAFPDALTASALGAANGFPVLLTAPDALPAATADALAQLRPARIVVLGGESSISSAVLESARTLTTSISRVSGADRYATNVAANAVITKPAASLVLAAGSNFPDALSGAALAGHLATAMMLVGSGGLSGDQRALIARLSPTHIDVLGGANAVADTVLNQVLVAAGLPQVATVSPPLTGDFVLNTHSGQVIRWNPCVAIGWKLNAGGLDAAAVDVIKTAVGVLGQATGMMLRFDGATDFVPSHANLETQPDDLVFAIAPRTSTDYFNGSGSDYVGYGGWYATSSNNGPWKISHGFVVLDAAAMGSVAHTGAAGYSLGTLTLHELGHAVGLDHAASPAEIMYPSLSDQTPATYSTADRLGLTALGTQAGCLP